MSLPDASLNILLINEHPEEIKLVTTSLRNFFSGCRIEAGYTSEDALAFSQQGDWHIILIDQELAPERGMDVIARLRRHAPYAAILLQTNENDSHAAIQALQHGADFLLFKQSPGFITELLFSVQEAVEKRELQMKLDHTFQRHLRFIETLSDLSYELDAEGRFVYVSPTVTSMLGYGPEELAGRHYSILLAPHQEQSGRFRLNERRAGSRSTRKFELTLHGKPLPDTPTLPVTVEVTAKGLFDSANRYLGTIGLLHDLSQEKAQRDRLTELESRLQETHRQLTLTREAARVSRQLQQPLATLLQDSQRLLTSIQDSRIEQHAETMVAKASHANRLSHQLTQVVYDQPAGFTPLNLNDVLQTVAQAVQPRADEAGIQMAIRLGDHVPTIVGSRMDLDHLAHILLEYAQHCLANASAPVRLILESGTIDLASRSIAQDGVTDPADPARTFASFTIRATVAAVGRPWNKESPNTVPEEQLLLAHRIVQVHNGGIEIEHTGDQGVTISVRLPAIADNSQTVSTFEHQPTSSNVPSRGDRRMWQRATQAARMQPDRRRSERKSFSLPVQLSIGGTTLRGVLRNMSTGGALFTIGDISASIHRQPAYLVIKTPVSFLEVHGVVHERASEADDVPFHGMREFAISFAPTVERDRNVLRSLLDGLHDGSTTVTFEGLILPNDTTDGASRELHAASAEPAMERRETTRLPLRQPVRIAEPDNLANQLLGHIVNLSLDGACLELPSGLEPLAIQSQLYVRPLEAREAANPDSNAAEEPWSMRLAWNSSRERVSRVQAGDRISKLVHVGVRFDHLSPAQEHGLRRLIADRTSLFEDRFAPMLDAAIVTDSTTIHNHDGQRLLLSHDYPRQPVTRQAPLVLLCPGYGTTQQHYVAIAYALAGAGLHVVRYDHSRHIGGSAGDPSHTTFTSLEDDLDTILTYAHREWPEAPLTLLAPDLIGRIALRRHDWQRQLHRLILFNPTLDLQTCLLTLHQRDLVQEHMEGSRLGLGNLLGLPLDIDHFLADAISAQYTNIAVLHEELTHCATDVVILTTEDATLDGALPAPTPSALNATMDRLGSRARKVCLAPPITPTNGLTPSLLAACAQQLLQLCQPGLPSQEAATVPSSLLSHLTSTRTRLESDRMRVTYALGTAGRERLWTTYSDLTRIFDELPAHWHAIDQMYQLLQPLDGSVRLLDVGCGQHSFARLLLLNLSYRLRAQSWKPAARLHYVGVDFTPSALHQAREATGIALQHVDQLFSGRLPDATPLTRQWVLSRSAEVLPFADHSFDRIAATLSLSFAHSPLHTLRELFRVLKPGGRLVISAFTPAADMSRLYRPAVAELRLNAFAGEARMSLNRMAQCCMGLRIGQVHSFEESTLNHYLAQVTPLPPRLLRALSGQLLLAAAEKPDSAG
ncbi:MAG: methyltransferase domain-containing protein [Nitrospira sp.]|nr:methyltransferase domain-containing protein [Nitrospira sp.]